MGYNLLADGVCSQTNQCVKPYENNALQMYMQVQNRFEGSAMACKSLK